MFVVIFPKNFTLQTKYRTETFKGEYLFLWWNCRKSFSVNAYMSFSIAIIKLQTKIFDCSSSHMDNNVLQNYFRHKSSHHTECRWRLYPVNTRSWFRRHIHMLTKIWSMKLWSMNRGRAANRWMTTNSRKKWLVFSNMMI